MHNLLVQEHSSSNTHKSLIFTSIQPSRISFNDESSVGFRVWIWLGAGDGTILGDIVGLRLGNEDGFSVIACVGEGVGNF